MVPMSLGRVPLPGHEGFNSQESLIVTCVSSSTILEFQPPYAPLNKPTWNLQRALLKRTVIHEGPLSRFHVSVVVVVVSCWQDHDAEQLSIQPYDHALPKS